MSLSALQEDLTIFTPSLMIRDSFHRSNVQRDSRELAKSGKLFCPHCYASNGELRTVFFRSGGELKRDHFFHPKNDIDLICPYSPMTEKHINAQSWVADHLSRKYPDALVKKEMQLRKSKDELCRPDICVILPDGTKFAYEIQVSKITEYEVKNRTERLQSNGCKAVTWFFTDLSDSLLIRECLALKKQHHALICFEEDSSVASISITNLKSVRQSLLQKLWDDHCLKEIQGMTYESYLDECNKDSKSIDWWYDRGYLWRKLAINPVLDVDMQLFSSILAVQEFKRIAEEAYKEIFLTTIKQHRVIAIKKNAKKRVSTPYNKTLFIPLVAHAQCLIFFLHDEVNKKSYDLPYPHYVVFDGDDFGFYGGTLSEAMSSYGGMKALYKLKEYAVNSQSFRDLYNPRVNELKFTNGDLGFIVYKGEMAISLHLNEYEKEGLLDLQSLPIAA